MPGFPKGVMVVRRATLTRVYLTATGAQNWACPAGVSEVAVVDCYGAGWYGGGAFARKNNVAVTPSTNIPYYIGTGSSGNDTWFKTDTTVKADASSGSAGATGGTAANSIGDLKYSGGNHSGSSNGGGGGAAGPNGSGLPGVADAGGAPNGGVGGGLGGIFGVRSPSRSDVYGSATYGPGGGGYGTTGAVAGNGAVYGGGGGTEDSEDPNNGVGGQGLIVLEYYV